MEFGTKNTNIAPFYIDKVDTSLSAFAVPSQKTSRQGGLGWILIFMMRMISLFTKNTRDLLELFISGKTYRQAELNKFIH
jgi:hypothetical protein